MHRKEERRESEEIATKNSKVGATIHDFKNKNEMIRNRCVCAHGILLFFMRQRDVSFRSQSSLLMCGWIERKILD